MPLAERFWSKVARGADDECWEWTASRTEHGYGRINVGGRIEKAPRVAWLVTYGDPGGLLVCHRCDNPPCCNPAHLFLGTVADNNADKIAKGRSNRGERHGQAILTAEKVRAMRDLREDGATFKEIARRFGVHHVTARHAVIGINWSHIP